MSVIIFLKNCSCEFSEILHDIRAGFFQKNYHWKKAQIFLKKILLAFAKNLIPLMCLFYPEMVHGSVRFMIL